MKLGSPVDCTYEGGHRALGRRGRNLWVADGRIGHGASRLKYAVPLSDVASVDVTERVHGGYRVHVRTVPDLGLRREPPTTLTDVTVRTRDGQAARWLVRGKGAEWVRQQLAPHLQEALIPFYDDLPPDERSPDC